MHINTASEFNARGEGKFPGHLGIEVTLSSRELMEGQFSVAEHHMAPNGFLHAGSVVTLADTLCGYGTVNNLPDTASGFTTVELKSNFFATALEGDVVGRATPVHVGRTSQVWDCEIVSRQTGKRMALFRCTQMVLYPKG